MEPGHKHRVIVDTINKITDLRNKYAAELSYQDSCIRRDTWQLDSLIKMIEVEQKFLLGLQQ